LTFEWPVKVLGDELTAVTVFPDVMHAGFHWMQYDKECYLDLVFIDSYGNEYSSGRIACENTTRFGSTDDDDYTTSAIDVTYTKAATSSDAATSYTYKVAFLGIVNDLADTYTWDGSYVDPTFCDNETQKMMVHNEMEFQENKCILNGFICSFDESA